MTREEKLLVYVVDDDDAVRDSLKLLLRSVDLPHCTFASAAEFLAHYDSDVVGCLIADIRMPGMSGLELQEELARRHTEIPIVFITGHGDVPMAVKAMKSGAMDFIQKPFRDQDLLDRVYRALELDREKREKQDEVRKAQRRLETLTPRETEVMEKVVNGHANKVIAQDLGVSQRTVELHRARVMHKMGVRSLAELVRLVGAARQL